MSFKRNLKLQIMKHIIQKNLLLYQYSNLLTVASPEGRHCFRPRREFARSSSFPTAPFEILASEPVEKRGEKNQNPVQFLNRIKTQKYKGGNLPCPSCDLGPEFGWALESPAVFETKQANTPKRYRIEEKKKKTGRSV